MKRFRGCLVVIAIIGALFGGIAIGAQCQRVGADIEYTLYEHFNEIQGTYDYSQGFSDSYWLAQTFTPQVDHEIVKVVLYLKQNDEDGGDLVCSIRATDENGYPTGEDLCSGSLDLDIFIGAGYAWINLFFDTTYNLTASTQYAVVCRTSGAPGGSPLSWYSHASIGEDLYPGGGLLYSDDAGESWESIDDPEYSGVGLWYEFYFEEWGSTGDIPTQYFIWEDVGFHVLNIDNATTSSGWTELNIGAYYNGAGTPKFAYLSLTIHVDAWAGGWQWLGVKKAGTTPTSISFIRAKFLNNNDPSYDNSNGTFIVALDDDGCIEYYYEVSGTGQADFDMYLFGWIVELPEPEPETESEPETSLPIWFMGLFIVVGGTSLFTRNIIVLLAGTTLCVVGIYWLQQLEIGEIPMLLGTVVFLCLAAFFILRLYKSRLVRK